MKKITFEKLVEKICNKSFCTDDYKYWPGTRNYLGCPYYDFLCCESKTLAIHINITPDVEFREGKLCFIVVTKTQIITIQKENRSFLIERDVNEDIHAAVNTYVKLNKELQKPGIKTIVGSTFMNQWLVIFKSDKRPDECFNDFASMYEWLKNYKYSATRNS